MHGCVDFGLRSYAFNKTEAFKMLSEGQAVEYHAQQNPKGFLPPAAAAAPASISSKIRWLCLTSIRTHRQAQSHHNRHRAVTRRPTRWGRA